MDDRQLLVVDVDEVRRLPRGPFVLRDDRRDRLADEAHALRTERVPLDTLRSHRGRVVRFHDGIHVVPNFLPRDHADDPGNRLGGLGVHAPDARMRIRAPHHGHVEHVVEPDVGDERALAGRELSVVQRRHALPDVFHSWLPG